MKHQKHRPKLYSKRTGNNHCHQASTSRYRRRRIARATMMMLAIAPKRGKGSCTQYQALSVKTWGEKSPSSSLGSNFYNKSDGNCTPQLPGKFPLVMRNRTREIKFIPGVFAQSGWNRLTNCPREHTCSLHADTNKNQPTQGRDHTSTFT